MKRLNDLLLAVLGLGVAALGSLAGSTGCGAAADHTATLRRLHEAMTAEVASSEILEDHNRLVEDVVSSGALEGLFQREVTERIGRGQECGSSELCADHGFRPTDWMYDVGHAPGDPGLAAGPTLVVGFDTSGRVIDTYYRTRR